jgi:hypothetical protein
MPELLLRQASEPLMAFAVGTTGSPGTNVDLDELCQFRCSEHTLLSFEGLGARARADLENSIATSIPVFF